MSADDGSGAPQNPSAEARFTMDPEKTLWELARHLVDSQRSYAQFSRAAQAARRLPDAPEVRKVVTDFETLERSWHTETLPAIIASMKLAIEVLDTFGPGLTDITDEIDAMVFNNKWFVWSKELTSEPWSSSPRSDDPEAQA
ncbi:MAG TPA: hypothetical protein VF477_06320 [Mycobacterium sp.]